ncbi:MAG: class I SAM-dependent methyltransferase [Candidatus Methanofastidiosia archaeon]|jgi:ubiquinone/menaquinone biosynthesis C-methylase UbiE
MKEIFTSEELDVSKAETWLKTRKKERLQRQIKHFRFYKEIFQNVLDSIILEAGCGSGRWISFLDTLHKTGVGLDFDIETLVQSTKYFSLSFQQSSFLGGDVRELPLKDNSIKGYVSIGVVEHFEDDAIKKIFADAYRVLKEDGIAFFSIPNKKALWKQAFNFLKKIGWNPQEKFLMLYERDLSLEQLCCFAESAGFHVLTMGYHDFWYNIYAPVKYIFEEEAYFIKNILLNIDPFGKIFKKVSNGIYLLCSKHKMEPPALKYGFSINHL